MTLLIPPLLNTHAESKGNPPRAKLAAELGVSVNTLRNWQLGAGAPGDDAAVTLAKVLDLPLDQVLVAAAHDRAVVSGAPPEVVATWREVYGEDE